MSSHYGALAPAGALCYVLHVARYVITGASEIEIQS